MKLLKNVEIALPCPTRNNNKNCQYPHEILQEYISNNARSQYIYRIYVGALEL